MRRIPNDKPENNEFYSTLCTEGHCADGNFSDGKDSETNSGCSHPSSPLRTPEPSTPPSIYNLPESKNHGFEGLESKDFDESIASILLALRDSTFERDFAPRLSPSKLPQRNSIETGIRDALEAGSESDAVINGRESSDSEYDWDGDGKTVDRSGKLKAPSGFACDKHKRWKKRCPSHCPMRKSPSIGNSYLESQQQQLEEDISRAHYNNINFPTTAQSQVVPMEEEVSIIPKLRKRSAPESSFNSDLKITAANTISCQFHAQLHARCPLNCPDRRIKTSSRKRQKLNNVDE